MARHIFLPPLSVHRHRLHPLGVCGFESFQTLHPRKRAARPDSRPLYELCLRYLPSKISQKYGIPYVVTKHSSTITRGLIRPHQWQPMKMRRRTPPHVSPSAAISHTSCNTNTAANGSTSPTYWAEYSTDRLNKEKKTTNRISCSAPSRTFCRLKGHDVLLTAFARALAQCPQLRLNIGGSGQEEQRLKQQAADLGITHAVTFLGALQPEAVLDLMRNSDAFVLASRTETLRRGLYRSTVPRIARHCNTLRRCGIYCFRRQRIFGSC